MTTLPAPKPLDTDDFDAMDAELDLLREGSEEIPQWEFCEGFLAALVCTRRPVPSEEYWPVLLGDDFNPMAHMEFVARWRQRWARRHAPTSSRALEAGRWHPPSAACCSLRFVPSDRRGALAFPTVLLRVVEMLLPVRRGEGRLTLALFLHSFFAVGAFLTGRTVRDTLFLQYGDKEQLAWMYVFSAIAVTAAGLIYGKLAIRVRSSFRAA